MSVSADIVITSGGVERLAGTAEYPDGIDASGLATPDVAGAGVNSESLAIETGASAGGKAGGITILVGDSGGDNGPTLAITGGASTLAAGAGGGVTLKAGDGDAGAGAGGDITLVPGGGNTKGILSLQDGNGDAQLRVAVAALGFFGQTPAAQPAVTGALSTVADAPAKAVLTSIIAALVGLGLATDGTT